MIDLHAHILPGFDDGVRSIEGARELARTALAEGVTAIAATPHVRADYPTSADRMLRGVEALRADFAAEGIELDVLTGGELELRRIWELSPGDLVRFTLAGNSRWLLVETPYRGWPPLLAHTLDALRAQGVEALLAHPERNDEVQRSPELLVSLVEAGTRVQITAASVDGRLGKASRACAMKLVDLGLAHVLASDAHHPEEREVGLTAAVETLGDHEIARRLTVDGPRAIVAGAEPGAVLG